LPEIAILIPEAGCTHKAEPADRFPAAGALIGVPKNQYACIGLKNPVILLLEKEFDNVKVMIFDSGFLHI